MNYFKTTRTGQWFLKFNCLIWIFSILLVSCIPDTGYQSEYDFDEIGLLHNKILTEALSSDFNQGASKEQLFEFVKYQLVEQGQEIEVDLV